MKTFTAKTRRRLRKGVLAFALVWLAASTALWPRLWRRCVVVRFDAERTAYTLDGGRASYIKDVRVYCNNFGYLVCIEAGGDEARFSYVVPYDKSRLSWTTSLPLGNLHRSSTGVNIVTTPLVAISKDVTPHLYDVNGKFESDKAHITEASSSAIAFTDANGAEIKITVR